MSLSYRITPGTALLRPLTRPTKTTPRCTAQQLGRRGKVSGSWLDRATKDSTLRAPKEQSQSSAQRDFYKDMMKTGNMPLFPVTFVALPLSEWPRSPAAFLGYLWAVLKSKVTSLGTVLQTKLQSQEKWTSRPAWKARRGRIPTAAKAMYRDAQQAFAAGDRAAIATLCTPHFASQLLSALERRPRSQRVRLEMSYTKPLLFPRLKSHLIGAFNPFDKHTLREQAVVAVSSFQKMTREEVRGGATVDRASKVFDKIEYVVLTRDVSAKSYESTPWKIWGTTTTTTLQQSKQQYEDLIRQHKKQQGWKT